MPKRKPSRKPRRKTADRRPAPAAKRTAEPSYQTAMFTRRLQGDEGPFVMLPNFEVDGAQCPEAWLDGPEVKEYADLLAMRLDLEHVITMSEQQSAIAKSTKLSALDAKVAMQATWEAAIMAYGRCFSSGVSAAPGGGSRTPFPKDVLDRLTPDQRAVHEHTLKLRNKHVGHRVNDWTQVRVTAVLNPPPGPRRFLHIAEKLVTVIGGGESAAALRQVAAILRDGLEERRRVIEADMEAQLNERPVDELYEAAAEEAQRTAQAVEANRKRQENPDSA